MDFSYVNAMTTTVYGYIVYIQVSQEDPFNRYLSSTVLYTRSSESKSPQNRGNVSP
jgi:hypothetical protein